MLESPFIRRLLNTNTLILICIIFTISTLFDLVLTVITVGDVGTTYVHLGSRLILCTFVSGSLLIFRYFKKQHFAILTGIHFLLALFFVALYTWIIGFFVEQHPNAMFYMVRSVLIVYPIIAAICIATDFILKTRKGKQANTLNKH
ncbi:MAG: hypothetical protein FWG63_10585 [Defluviitaleaceae bacterium]|nr:hypothetical protein [Defluviitaleaceae bacterium]